MAFRARDPFNLPPGGSSDPRTVADAIRDANVGQTGEVTLTESAATTVVNDPRVDSLSSAVTFSPTTANAAAEVGNGTMYITYGDGSFTLTHANNAQTDRTFRYAVNN